MSRILDLRPAGRYGHRKALPSRLARNRPVGRAKPLIYKEVGFDPENRPYSPHGAVQIAAPAWRPAGKSRRAPEKAILSLFRPGSADRPHRRVSDAVQDTAERPLIGTRVVESILIVRISAIVISWIGAS